MARRHADVSEPSSDPADTHPLIQGLFHELPAVGTAWDEQSRKLWLDTAASIFQMVYKIADEPPAPVA